MGLRLLVVVIAVKLGTAPVFGQDYITFERLYAGNMKAPSVQFSPSGKQALIYERSSASTAFHVTWGKQHESNVIRLEVGEGLRPTFSDEALLYVPIDRSEPNPSRYDTTPYDVKFIDSEGSEVLPLAPNARPVRPCYPPRQEPRGIIAVRSDENVQLTVGPRDSVNAMFYDPKTNRVLLETDVSPGTRWVNIDGGTAHGLDHKDLYYEGMLSDFGPLRYWLVPGEDAFLLPLRRVINEFEIEFRLAFCDLSGNMLGVLPMSPSLQSYQEAVCVFASDFLLVVSLGDDDKVYVYQKEITGETIESSDVVVLKPSPELDAAVRNTSRDYVLHLLRAGFILPTDLDSDMRSALPSYTPYDLMVPNSIPPIKWSMQKVFFPDIDGSYELAVSETEVTNELFVSIMNWARVEGRFDSLDESGGILNGQPVAPIDPSGQIVRSGVDFAILVRDGMNMEAFPVLTNAPSAMAFCNWLSEIEGLAPCYDLKQWQLVAPFSGGYRLPTREEWMKAFEAANAGNNDKWWKNRELRSKLATCDACNPINLRTAPYLSPVGYYARVRASKKQTSAGLVDMVGNAPEIVHGAYAPGDRGSSSFYRDFCTMGGGWANCERIEQVGAHAWAGLRIVRVISEDPERG